MPESGRFFQELGDLLQLRDCLLGVAAILANNHIIIKRHAFHLRGQGWENTLKMYLHMKGLYLLYL